MSANPFVELIGRYFDFGGRTSRGSFWISYIIGNIVFAVYFAFALEPSFDAGTVESAVQHNPLLSLFAWLIIFPTIPLQIRRLHDVGRSGWWMLLYFTLIGDLLLLYWFLKGGERKTNAFGKNPLAKSVASPPNIPAPPARDPSARLDDLKGLGELRDGGVLSEAEFAHEKARVLGSDGVAAPARSEMFSRAYANEGTVGGRKTSSASKVVATVLVVALLGAAAIVGYGLMTGGSPFGWWRSNAQTVSQDRAAAIAAAARQAAATASAAASAAASRAIAASDAPAAEDPSAATVAPQAQPGAAKDTTQESVTHEAPESAPENLAAPSP
jgi:uncharacterized membrane protein YhaH (DUF805 family)